MSKVVIYVDGACSGNPGPGGWGAYLCYGDKELKLSGCEENTTNNQMELTAAIKALQALRKPCDVEIYTDSTYVKKGITEWINNWVKNDWKSANKSPVKNTTLWQELLAESRKHKIEWFWVKGHSNNKGNCIADKLAVEAIKKPNSKNKENML